MSLFVNLPIDVFFLFLDLSFFGPLIYLQYLCICLCVFHVELFFENCFYYFFNIFIHNWSTFVSIDRPSIHLGPTIHVYPCFHLEF